MLEGILPPHDDERQDERGELDREVPYDRDLEPLEAEEEPVDVEGGRDDVRDPQQGEDRVAGHEGVADIEGGAKER